MPYLKNCCTFFTYSLLRTKENTLPLLISVICSFFFAEKLYLAAFVWLWAFRTLKGCLTPKLKTKIGQGFLHLLTCSTVLHLRFCLRVCYRGSNYLLGPQHQRWWKGKKWWLDCGKPGGLCKTLFFD